MAYGESRRSAKLTKKCLTLPIKSNFRDSKVNLKTLRPSLIIVMAITLAALTGCRSSRHVPQGSYLLDEVEIKVNDSTHTIDRQEMLTYLRQQPNHKMLWSTKFRLGVYTLRLTSEEQLHKALVNKGFMDAQVSSTVMADSAKRKVRVEYDLQPGAPHVMRSISYEFPNDTIKQLVMRDSDRFVIRKGDRLDRSLLETQRDLVTASLRNRGYYGFAKEFITFNADTTEGCLDVDLTMTENPTDSVTYKDITILYGKKHYLRPSVLYDNCFLRRGRLYRQRDVDRTYQALSRLDILKFVNIRFLPVGGTDQLGMLDAYILLTPGKSQSFSVELEGTNSEGDLGVAAALNYAHRNVGKGTENLAAKVRGAYESLSGDLDGLLHNRYMEYSLELGVNFPKFKAPFLKESFKRKINATTDLHVSMTYQERPEYTRIISTAGWSYKWTGLGQALALHLLRWTSTTSIFPKALTISSTRSLLTILC